jgi:hypothetical protein
MMPDSVELVEVAPNRWRVLKHTPQNFARSEHPRPYIISDTMEPTEQVDGQFYTSKSAFRRVGRQLGLIEVGNEKQMPKPKGISHADKSHQEGRRQAIEKAIAQYRAGRRPET